MPGQDRSTVRWLARGGLLVYWLVMFAATHLPPPAILVAVDVSDTWQHFVAYAGFGGLIGLLFATRNRRWLMAAWVITVSYAIVDEWSQGFVGRTPELKDWLADVAGATCGLLLGLLVIGLWKRGRP